MIRQSEKRVKFFLSPTLRELFSMLWKDRISGISMRLTLFFLIFLFGDIIFFFWRLPPEIPLTYSRPWGSEQLVPPFFLFIVLAITLLLVFINNLIAASLITNEKLLARILVWSSTLVVFLTDITILRVLLLVT